MKTASKGQTEGHCWNTLITILRNRLSQTRGGARDYAKIGKPMDADAYELTNDNTVSSQLKTSAVIDIPTNTLPQNISAPPRSPITENK